MVRSWSSGTAHFERKKKNHLQFKFCIYRLQDDLFVYLRPPSSIPTKFSLLCRSTILANCMCPSRISSWITNLHVDHWWLRLHPICPTTSPVCSPFKVKGHISDTLEEVGGLPKSTSIESHVKISDFAALKSMFKDWSKIMLHQPKCSQTQWLRSRWLQLLYRLQVWHAVSMRLQYNRCPRSWPSSA